MLQHPLPQPSLADFRWIDWPSKVSETVGDDSQELHRLFNEQAVLARSQSDVIAEGVYQVLSAASSFRLNLDKRDDPFSPAFLSDSYRSASGADLDSETARALGLVASRTSNAFLQARLAD